MDDNVTLFKEANTTLLQSEESMVIKAVATEEPFEVMTSSLVNVLLALLAVILSYYVTLKLSQRTQDDHKNESQKHQTEPTCVEEHTLNEDGVSLFSKLTYNWVLPLLRKGNAKAGLTSEDMFSMPNDLNVKRVQEHFSETFHLVDRSVKTNEKKKSTLLQALYKAYGLHFFLYCGILELIAHLINFTGPISLGLLIAFFENGDEPSYIGYRYALLLFLSSFGKALLESRFHFVRMHVFMKVRMSIMTTIYQKALRISTVSLSKFSTGEIVNFLGTDTDRMMGFCHCFHALWSLPFETILCMYILYQLVGMAMLGGLAVALVLVPINKIISTKQIALGKLLMKEKDKRTKVCTT